MPEKRRDETPKEKAKEAARDAAKTRDDATERGQIDEIPNEEGETKGGVRRAEEPEFLPEPKGPVARVLVTEELDEGPHPEGSDGKADEPEAVPVEIPVPTWQAVPGATDWTGAPGAKPPVRKDEDA
jgi:hypothetical protein